MGTSSRWVVGPALALLMVGAGGCSSASDAPSPSASTPGHGAPAGSSAQPGTPSTTVATPATAATTGSAADIPPAARPATMEGAQAFVAHWVAQFNTAFQKADPKPLQVVSGDACPACNGYISEVKDLTGQQRHAQGELWTATAISVEQFDGAASAVVFATVQQHAIPVMDQTGAVVDHYKNRTEELGFTLTHNGTNWRVVRVQVAQ